MIDYQLQFHIKAEFKKPLSIILPELRLRCKWINFILFVCTYNRFFSVELGIYKYVKFTSTSKKVNSQ